MTPKELYDWAVENNCNDYDIKVAWGDEYSYGYDFPEERQLEISPSAEQITIDV